MVLGSDVRNLVKTLKESYTTEEIAQILEIDEESVKKCLKDYELLQAKGATLKLKPLSELKQQPESANQKREVGRPKVFENRKLVEQLLQEHPEYTSIDVQRELLSQFGIEVSRRTLQRRISEIRSKQFQLKNGGLSAEVKQKRIEWARAHEEWTVQDWRNIFNMDDFKVDNGTPPKEIYLDTLVGPESGDCNDLSLLQQLMAIIEPKIESQAPKDVYEFRSVLYDIWHSDHELVSKIEQLYESMPWRITAVLQSGGAESGF
ncbi:hypothetical protein KR222_006520 [Zaprionus bogoriensis]|nr:hypothetical protein KR222_006520 [Zaprionus bogoriensis]